VPQCRLVILLSNAAMAAYDDPVVVLCGASFSIRIATFDHLSAAHQAVRRSES
jgi:hypothetical protein